MVSSFPIVYVVHPNRILFLLLKLTLRFLPGIKLIGLFRSSLVCGLPRLNPGRRPAPTFELIFLALGLSLLLLLLLLGLSLLFTAFRDPL